MEFEKVEFNLEEWLNEVNQGTGRSNAELICYLLYANQGRFRVTGWGITSSFNGHQIGLEMEEAIQLIYYDGFVQGLIAGGVSFGTTFYPIFEAYVLKVSGKTREELYGVPH